MIDSQTFPLCPPHAKLERTHGIRLDFGGCVQCRLNELAQLREKLAAAEKLLREAIEPGVFGIQDRSRISAPEDEMIRKLGLQIGFGALMDSASRMWAIVAEQDGHPGSEFVVSACAATQKRWVAQVEELLAIIDGNDVLKEGV